MSGPRPPRSAGDTDPAAATPPALDARARALLAELAAGPRQAGSAAESAARARCALWLNGLGFQVTERPFHYSALPGRWGTPIAGAGQIVALSLAAALGAMERPGAGLATLVGAALAIALTGRWMARSGILSLPLLRRRSVNLLATRGERPPEVWLVAHLDSKSQPVSIGLRAAGVMGSLVTWLAGGALLLATLAGWPPPEVAWLALAAAGLLCALPVVASTVSDHSDGAVDNASGVAAVLAAAALIAADGVTSVGVALTSAEELGLAGSRSWAAGTSPATALNCDGVDDTGEVVIMYSGRAPRAVLDAFARAAPAGRTPRVRRLLPGILTDHVALADAGWATATVSRGGAGTLRRIHTRADSLARLRGDGLLPVARLLAGAATSVAGPAAASARQRGGADGGVAG